MNAASSVDGDAQKLRIVDAGNGQFALWSSTILRYVTALDDGRLVCEATVLDDRGKFTWEYTAGADQATRGIRTFRNLLWSAQPDGRLVADRSALQGWEMFTVTDVPAGQSAAAKSAHPRAPS